MGCLLTCRTMTELNASAPAGPSEKAPVGKAPCDRQVRSSVDAGAGEVKRRGGQGNEGWGSPVGRSPYLGRSSGALGPGLGAGLLHRLRKRLFIIARIARGVVVEFLNLSGNVN